MDKDIYLNPVRETSASTISVLNIDGDDVCYVLEDGYNKIKIPKQTRIPAGRYRLAFRTEGTHNDRYKKMYPDWHVGMIELQDVPDFQHILIHIGNTVNDTDGCLLVGKSYQLNLKTGLLEVVNSKPAYTKVGHQITDLMKDNTVYINIIRK